MSFGWSVSDIATAISFIAKVVQALNSADGASADYREAVAFLEDLNSTLESLHTLTALQSFPTYGDTVRKKVEDIRGPIEEFLKAVEKYAPSLGVNAKKGHHRNVCKKLEWRFSVSKDLEKLRKKVGDHLAVIDKLLHRLTIDMLWVVQHNLSSENLQRAFREVLDPLLVTALRDQIQPLRWETLSNHDKQTQQHEAVISELRDQSRQIELIPGMLRQCINNPICLSSESQSLRVREQCILTAERTIKAQGQILDDKTESCDDNTGSDIILVAKGILRELYYMIFLHLGRFLRDFFLAISRLVQPTKALGPALPAKNNISFFDAIGRPGRILQYDVFISYKVFEAFVEDAFSDTPGSQWVMRGLYRLSDARNGKHLTKETWSQKISPGTGILMCMVLEEQLIESLTLDECRCPSPACCGALQKKVGALWLKCSKCEVEVVDIEVGSSKILEESNIPATLRLEWDGTNPELELHSLNKDEDHHSAILSIEDISHFKRIAQLRRCALRSPSPEKRLATMPRTSVQLTFNLKTSMTVKMVYLIGSWDKYAGQLPLHHNKAASAKTYVWNGTFRFMDATLKPNQRYWYYYLIDGYHVSHDPSQVSAVEPTTGRIVNILDVPSTSFKYFSSPVCELTDLSSYSPSLPAFPNTSFCSCERYGITRAGERIKLDCGGSRSGGSHCGRCCNG